MSPAATPGLVEVHEDRIMRLEENFSDVKAVQAAHSTQLLMIDQGVRALASKFDGMIKLDTRVSTLEKVEEARGSKHTKRNTAIVALTCALVGVIGGLLKNWIFGG
jgi:uncharacterized protein related to proFAR isomerase